MDELMARMQAALEEMEQMLERFAGQEQTMAAAAEERVAQIVATVESQREAELAERLRETEEKLAEAEQRVAEISASAQGRKTAAVGMVATLAKQGIAAGALEGLSSGRMEAGALDAALASLSIEQRFAVKGEMLRAGLLG